MEQGQAQSQRGEPWRNPGTDGAGEGGWSQVPSSHHRNNNHRSAGRGSGQGQYSMPKPNQGGRGGGRHAQYGPAGYQQATQGYPQHQPQHQPQQHHHQQQQPQHAWNWPRMQQTPMHMPVYPMPGQGVQAYPVAYYNNHMVAAPLQPQPIAASLMQPLPDTLAASPPAPIATGWGGRDPPNFHTNNSNSSTASQATPHSNPVVQNRRAGSGDMATGAQSSHVHRQTGVPGPPRAQAMRAAGPSEPRVMQTLGKAITQRAGTVGASHVVNLQPAANKVVENGATPAVEQASKPPAAAPNSSSQSSKPATGADVASTAQGVNGTMSGPEGGKQTPAQDNSMLSSSNSGLSTTGSISFTVGSVEVIASQNSLPSESATAGSRQQQETSTGTPAVETTGPQQHEAVEHDAQQQPQQQSTQGHAKASAAPAAAGPATQQPAPAPVAWAALAATPSTVTAKAGRAQPAASAPAARQQPQPAAAMHQPAHKVGAHSTPTTPNSQPTPISTPTSTGTDNMPQQKAAASVPTPQPNSNRTTGTAAAAPAGKQEDTVTDKAQAQAPIPPATAALGEQVADRNTVPSVQPVSTASTPTGQSADANKTKSAWGAGKTFASIIATGPAGKAGAGTGMRKPGVSTQPSSASGSRVGSKAATPSTSVGGADPGRGDANSSEAAKPSPSITAAAAAASAGTTAGSAGIPDQAKAHNSPPVQPTSTPTTQTVNQASHAGESQGRSKAPTSDVAPVQTAPAATASATAAQPVQADSHAAGPVPQPTQGTPVVAPTQSWAGLIRKPLNKPAPSQAASTGSALSTPKATISNGPVSESAIQHASSPPPSTQHGNLASSTTSGSKEAITAQGYAMSPTKAHSSGGAANANPLSVQLKTSQQAAGPSPAPAGESDKPALELQAAPGPASPSVSKAATAAAVASMGSPKAGTPRGKQVATAAPAPAGAAAQSASGAAAAPDAALQQPPVQAPKPAATAAEAPDALPMTPSTPPASAAAATQGASPSLSTPGVSTTTREQAKDTESQLHNEPSQLQLASVEAPAGPAAQQPSTSTQASATSSPRKTDKGATLPDAAAVAAGTSANSQPASLASTAELQQPTPAQAPVQTDAPALGTPQDGAPGTAASTQPEAAPGVKSWAKIALKAAAPSAPASGARPAAARATHAGGMQRPHVGVQHAGHAVSGGVHAAGLRAGLQATAAAAAQGFQVSAPPASMQHAGATHTAPSGAANLHAGAPPHVTSVGRAGANAPAATRSGEGLLSRTSSNASHVSSVHAAAHHEHQPANRPHLPALQQQQQAPVAPEAVDDDGFQMVHHKARHAKGAGHQDAWHAQQGPGRGGRGPQGWAAGPQFRHHQGPGGPYMQQGMQHGRATQPGQQQRQADQQQQPHQRSIAPGAYPRSTRSSGGGSALSSTAPHQQQQQVTAPTNTVPQQQHQVSAQQQQQQQQQVTAQLPVAVPAPGAVQQQQQPIQPSEQGVSEPLAVAAPAAASGAEAATQPETQQAAPTHDSQQTEQGPAPTEVADSTPDTAVDEKQQPPLEQQQPVGKDDKSGSAEVQDAVPAPPSTDKDASVMDSVKDSAKDSVKNSVKGSMPDSSQIADEADEDGVGAAAGNNLFSALALEDEPVPGKVQQQRPAPHTAVVEEDSTDPPEERARKELHRLVCNPQDVLPPSSAAVAAAGPGSEIASAAAGAAAAALRYQPRGLVNTGNTCFINSPLQALLGCAPFCTLLMRLEKSSVLLDATQTPTLHGLAAFAAQLGAGVTPSSGTANGPVTTAAAGSNATPVQGNGNVVGGEVPGAQDETDSSGWSQVGGKAKKGKKGGVQLAVFQMPTPVQPKKSSSTNKQQQGTQQAGKGAAVAAAASGAVAGLWSKPVVPTALNAVIRKFSCEYAANKDGEDARTDALLVQRTGTKAGGLQHQEQQDAQEFLHFLLDHAHEELLLLAKSAGIKAVSDGGAADGAFMEDDGEEWAQVGKRNKAAVTRQAGGRGVGDGTPRTAIESLFLGATKSVIKCANCKPSATVEPFMMLHLDIELPDVTDVESALAHLLATVTLSDYKPEGSNAFMPAVKNAYLYRLPQLMVLHLKRFAYTNSIVKNHKHIAFDFSLRLRKPIIGEDCPDVGRGGVAEYALVATVSHHGKHAAGGHYTADVQQPDGQWLRFNDTAVDVVSANAVLHEQPYLLLYQRV